MKTMKQPLVSVIVPVYNVEKYLDRCIKSILAQTYKNLEIVLIDDGSTDESGELCSVYAKSDKRVKVLHKKNGGLSDARNVGIEQSKGKYCCFVDGDDYVSSNYVRELIELTTKYKTRMSICAYNLVKGKKERSTASKEDEKVLSVEECLSKMLVEDGFTVTANSKMFERSLFSSIEFPRGKLYEDNAVMHRLIMECDKIAYSSKASYYYVIRKGSITQSGFNVRKLDYIDNVDGATEEILAEFPNLEKQCEIRRIRARINVLRQIVSSREEQKYKRQEQKVIKELREMSRCLGDNPYADFKMRFFCRVLLKNVHLLKIAEALYG